MLKVYEQLKSGNYNFYVFRGNKWEKVNHAEITDFTKIDKDAISTREFITDCFSRRDFNSLKIFYNFIEVNNY